MAAWATAWQKTIRDRRAWRFKPKNYYKSLLGPVGCSNGFAPWGVVRRQRWSAAVVFLVIEKNGSQVFLLSLTKLMWPYIVKMTWSRPKMPCPQRFLFLFGS